MEEKQVNGVERSEMRVLFTLNSPQNEVKGTEKH